MKYHQSDSLSPLPLWIKENDVKVLGSTMIDGVLRSCREDTPERRRIIGYIKQVVREMILIVRKEHKHVNGTNGIQTGVSGSKATPDNERCRKGEVG